MISTLIYGRSIAMDIKYDTDTKNTYITSVCWDLKLGLRERVIFTTITNFTFSEHLPFELQSVDTLGDIIKPKFIDGGCTGVWRETASTQTQ